MFHPSNYDLAIHGSNFVPWKIYKHFTKFLDNLYDVHIHKTYFLHCLFLHVHVYSIFCTFNDILVFIPLSDILDDSDFWQDDVFRIMGPYIICANVRMKSKPKLEIKTYLHMCNIFSCLLLIHEKEFIITWTIQIILQMNINSSSQ